MTQLSNTDRARLLREVERIVTHEGMELVDLEFRHERGSWVLRIFIDRPGGVSVDDCADISNQVGMMLDVEDIIPHKYALEVSSPGLDRPLKKREDFERFQGRRVRIRLKDSHEGRKKYQGRIDRLEGDAVVLLDTDEGRTHTIQLMDIRSARLKIEL